MLPGEGHQQGVALDPAGLRVRRQRLGGSPQVVQGDPDADVAVGGRRGQAGQPERLVHLAACSHRSAGSNPPMISSMEMLTPDRRHVARNSPGQDTAGV